MDASGRVYGDIGYDPSTEIGNDSPSSGNVYNSPFQLFTPKVETPTDEELWLEEHPPSEMPPVDFSSSPSWWGKGGTGGTTAPARPAPVQRTSAPIMLDVIGNLGGTSGFTGQTPMNKSAALAAALRSGGK